MHHHLPNSHPLSPRRRRRRGGPSSPPLLHEAVAITAAPHASFSPRARLTRGTCGHIDENGIASRLSGTTPLSATGSTALPPPAPCQLCVPTPPRDGQRGSTRPALRHHPPITHHFRLSLLLLPPHTNRGQTHARQEQAASSKQQGAGSKEQAARSRQQAATSPPVPCPASSSPLSSALASFSPSCALSRAPSSRAPLHRASDRAQAQRRSAHCDREGRRGGRRRREQPGECPRRGGRRGRAGRGRGVRGRGVGTSRIVWTLAAGSTYRE